MICRIKFRGLSEADRAAWAQVAATITPRAPAPAVAPAPALPRLAAPAHAPAPRISAPFLPALGPAAPPTLRRSLRPTGSGAIVDPMMFVPAPSVIDRLDPATGLDGRTATRVKRGKRAPESRIDLHGMTAADAHGALTHFIRGCHGRGLRFVLVITGKGGRRRNTEDAAFIPEGAGVLRHAAPRWLREAPMRPLITGVYPAHQRHGGDGAFYIQLSKRR
jgi:DNA-nicking Smr family endonuclease